MFHIFGRGGLLRAAILVVATSGAVSAAHGADRADSAYEFDQDFKINCMKFEQLSNTYELRKGLIVEMEKSPFPIDRFWTEAGCRPYKIGGTVAPIIHLVAEEVGGRTAFLKTLYQYYDRRGDLQTWLRVINARNSRGHTFLDYIEYLKKAKEYRDVEREDVATLIRFACEHGGQYSAMPEKRCP